ncbi:MAG: alkaline phosphatase family protein [Gemmatimonadaceae bacterium]
MKFPATRSRWRRMSHPAFPSSARSFLLVYAIGVVGCASAQVPSSAAPPAASEDSLPRLVLLLTVDAFRADYMDRWPGQMTGGVERLFRGGAYFPMAIHDHALTSTAPGHAVIGSGRFPGSTGIISNAEGVGGEEFPLIAGVGFGASPSDFQGTTLADWMSQHDRRTRVFATSYKDRSAILPVGRRVADVYWYSGSGLFTTSTYYRKELPEWVQAFNARGLAWDYADRTWNLLLPESEYPEPDSEPAENLGQGFTFPHTSGDTPRYAPTVLRATPWVDELTLQFALAGFHALGLGRGPQTDFMAVGLSGTDPVGHTYGPDSREVHDQVLRLDRQLGAFLDSIFAVVGEHRVLIVLTSDHGLTPLAGVVRPGRTGARYRVTTTSVLAPIRAELAQRGVDPSAVQIDFGVVNVDSQALRAGGVDPDSVISKIAATARITPGIARVDRPSELARADTVNDYVARRWLHTLAPQMPGALVLTVAPGSYWSGTGEANHGGPHADDVTIPLVFFGRPFVQQRLVSPARPVDIAPTLARVLGLTPAERLDGVVLDAALRKR